MSDIGIGKIINQERGRDAIHVAVAPVTAAERLSPGEHVGLTIDGRACAGNKAVLCKPIGIVDPFLTEWVDIDEKFYLFLYPGSITSLRHEWTHPAMEQKPIEPIPDKAASETWLRDFCKSADCPDYETVLKAISGGMLDTVDEVYGNWSYIDADSIRFRGRDAHGPIPPEFWHHAKIVLGDKLLSYRPSFFSCSC